eukprot:m.379998 g.379998  ORF g.379998 m.379998 type:complete len:433 (+) comp20957_c2_seq48:2555-3853(+)
MISLIICCVIYCGGVAARDDGLRTPPMGWMSWERYGCQKDCVNFPNSCISADLFLAQAQKLVDLGLKDVGYNRIDVDDCYMDVRDPRTNDLRADETRFPGGIPSLSRKIHALGLKLGVYNDIGRTTCAGNPGLNVSEQDDAAADAQLKRDVTLMAHEWEIDSIKIDGCARPANSNMTITYPKLGKYLNSTGRQILYSCSWPVYASCNGYLNSEECFPMEAITEACSTWRVSKDIMDVYNLPGHSGILQLIDFYAQNNESLRAASGPGQYNDYDMLLGGNRGLSLDEARIQFGMWAMWSAPLLMSNDLRTISSDFVKLYSNTEVIAVDQDSLGASASGSVLINNTNVMSAQVSVWHKPLSVAGTRAVALLNTGLFDAAVYNLTLTPELIGFPAGATYSARDLFSHKDLGKFHGATQYLLQPTTITMLKVTLEH